MKIIIIGDGKVGHNLAESLSNEDNDVTIIDKDPEALRKSDESLDVMCVRGNGVSVGTLIEAGVKEADLIIAATTSDEINMVCCLMAKRLGAVRTIARIRDPEYANELSVLKSELGLNLVINPEQAAADEIARILRFPSAIHVDFFAKGKVELVEIKIIDDVPIKGMKLRDIPVNMLSSVLIGAVVRNNEVIIPNGDFRIEENDILYIIGKPSSVFGFCKFMGKYCSKVKNVMVVGGGRIAYYLTNQLQEMGMKVKIIDNDIQRCEELSELLPNTLVIHGDGTDEELLQSESISDMGAFISITGKDEDNLMSALLARQNGVPKVIPKISKMNYIGIVNSIGIESVVSPKQVITNHILKYVRGLKNAEGNKIESLFRIIEGKAEIVEFSAGDSGKFLEVPLKKIKIKKDAIVATIVRNNEIIIPHGNDVIKAGDKVIVITKEKNISDLNEVISTGGIHSELQNNIKKFGNIISI
ncbi:MAG: Trk system potassium transporter TrkA [Acetivibrionales bacterium]|jgi:trk system potassium uptake protein TrkA